MSNTTSPPSDETKTMPPPNSSKPLTLIVATTKFHGIGRAGNLPWPQLKGEMAYFARVTKRTPTPPPSTTSAAPTLPVQPRNAVIMGRKTWESIPVKFRPLKGRLNCVISRSLAEKTSSPSPSASAGPASAETGDVKANSNEVSHAKKEERNADVLFVGSINEALEATKRETGHVFVIGGGSVYDAALELPQARRVLLTRIREPEFECDTFFPLDLEGEEAASRGWKRMGRERFEEVTGEELGSEGAVRREGDVEYEFCLYER